LAPALQNLPPLLVKIVYLPQPPQPLPHYVMQLANLRSYTAAKAISESASLLPNVYLDFVTLFRLGHR
jgi:hypothetical protein